METDRFVWRWTADGKYSVRSAYRTYFTGWTTMAGAKEIWRAPVPPKVKFFFWIVLHGRLWTAERRQRHGLQQSATYVLCDQLDETTDHLLCSCVYAREVWSLLLLAMASLTTAPQQDSTVLDWWLSSKATIPEALRRSFDFILLATWNLWKERNRGTFDRESCTPPQLVNKILEKSATPL
jgi:hypothetical protein